MTIKQLIETHGGPDKISAALHTAGITIPHATITAWYYGSRKPPPYVTQLIHTTLTR